MFFESKTRARILITSMAATFVLIRVYLYFYPNADFDVLGYNIHHLYSGFILVMFAGIPLVLFKLPSRISYIAIFVFGVGMSLVLDEWVYLIATDGSNSSYLLPVSFWGGVVMILIACAYTGFLVYWLCQRNNEQGRK